MINATGTEPVVSRRPAWATRSEFNHDTEERVGITHGWTAPTTANASAILRDELAPVEVKLVQRDDFVITPDGVLVKAGKVEVWIPDADLTFTDTAEARRFAAAVLEAADRAEAAESGR